MFLEQKTEGSRPRIAFTWQQMGSRHGGFETRQAGNASTLSLIPTSPHGKVGEKNTQKTSWKLSWKHARALVERRTLKLALGVLEEHGRDPLGSEGTARMYFLVE